MAIDPHTEQQETVKNWPLRRVGLRVQNMQRSLDYYQRLGLTVVRDERDVDGNGSVGLGAGTNELLQLRTLPGGRPRPRHTAGLFHFALLVPDEPSWDPFYSTCWNATITSRWEVPQTIWSARHSI
ncbi:hypothetical protein KDW_45910 [Dictyobacter vulcani]|uniref:Glyoxalase/fosfomycin resistance/dioxygenase domain-containing protein n=1 Tax=Dictyobacter vulcani TaxID=2607529 RepID=A0A5J4KWC4_9CHLR|nr:VOC family protein [Dictyobacter vulcani]GER90429.1 hypothetical protein KDW_45910 [Dictyobacter vulcani]